MKKLNSNIFIILTFAIIATNSLFSQSTDTSFKIKICKSNVSFNIENLMVTVTNDNIMTNDSNFHSKEFNPNIGFFYIHPFKLGKTGFSIGTGLGFSFSKVCLDNTILTQSTAGTSFLKPSSHPWFQGADKTYKESSFYTSWLDFPLELGYQFKNSKGKETVNIAIGMRAGLRLAGNTKITFIENSTTKEIATEEKSMSGLNSFRYGITGKLGYKSVSLFGYYGLNTLLKDSKNYMNQDLRQYSLGVAFIL